MNEWSMRKRIVVMFAIVAGLVTVLNMVGFQAASASEPVASTIIRTHEHMFVPDHVFRSEFERCSLPSREKLAAQTGTKLKNWSEPYFGNRQIDYYGDPEVTVTIQNQKDQELTSGEFPQQKLRVYTAGETYSGTLSFSFRCYHSRNGWFNPNTPDFCPSKVEKLESWTSRDWDGYENHWRELPSGLYEYIQSRPMAGFWVPRSSHFEIYKTQAGTIRVTTTGYLTKKIPHRDRPFMRHVQVLAFC